MTNSILLREKIKESGLKLKYLAEQLNITAFGLQKKIDNINEFKVSEVDKLCEILHITKLTEKEMIFFAKQDDK